MIYRGQTYGAPVGRYWSTNIEDAEGFAMASSRSYVILALDEDDEEWLAKFHVGTTAKGEWYDIPISQLKKRWFGVSIVGGSIKF